MDKLIEFTGRYIPLHSIRRIGVFIHHLLLVRLSTQVASSERSCVPIRGLPEALRRVWQIEINLYTEIRGNLSLRQPYWTRGSHCGLHHRQVT